MRLPPMPGIDYPCPEASDDEIDRVYDRVSNMLSGGELHSINSMLEAVDVTTIDVVLVLAYLSITSHAKRLLPARIGYYARTKDHLSLIRPLDVNALLQGLQ